MSEEDDRRNYPWWVRVTLIGLHSRSAVLAFFWLCLACFPLFVGVGLWLRSVHADYSLGGFYFLLAGVLSIPAAMMYLLTVRWVDRHGRW